MRPQPVEQITDGIAFAEAASTGGEKVAVIIWRDGEHADPTEGAGIQPMTGRRTGVDGAEGVFTLGVAVEFIAEIGRNILPGLGKAKLHRLRRA